MRSIIASRGEEVLVSPEDYDWLSGYGWCVAYIKGRPNNVFRGKVVDGVFEHRTMARDVLGDSPSKEHEPDHVNRNPLDNRRENLRWCTRAQNARNRRGWGSVQFKGVSVNPKLGPCARIQVDGYRYHIGYFPTVEEAAYMYDQFALQLHGEYAVTNFLEVE